MGVGKGNGIRKPKVIMYKNEQYNLSSLARLDDCAVSSQVLRRNIESMKLRLKYIHYKECGVYKQLKTIILSDEELLLCMSKTFKKVMDEKSESRPQYAAVKTPQYVIFDPLWVQLNEIMDRQIRGKT